MFPPCFYFNLFLLQNSFFKSTLISKKHIFSFRSSRSLTSLRSSHPFLKKHWNTPKSSHTIFNMKKYIQKQLHIFFHGFCTLISFRSSRPFFKNQEIYSEAAAQVFTVSAQNELKIFHNLLIVMKKHLWWLVKKSNGLVWMPSAKT